MIFLETAFQPYDKELRAFKRTTRLRVHYYLENNLLINNIKAMQKDNHVQELVRLLAHVFRTTITFRQAV